MRTVVYEEYEAGDLIERALTLTAKENPTARCDGGPHCPRCRLAQAKTQLEDELELSFTYGDDILFDLCGGLPHRPNWPKSDSDDVLLDLLKKNPVESSVLQFTLEEILHDHYEDRSEGLMNCAKFDNPAHECDCGADAANVKIRRLWESYQRLLRGESDGSQ